MSQWSPAAPSRPMTQPTQSQRDHAYMHQALALAARAGAAGEVPVGAVLVHNDTVIGQGGNGVIATCDATAHAEICALRAAGQRLSNYRFPEATLYVTLEPCIMCAGAIVQVRLARVVFALYDARFGAAGSQLNLLQSAFLNHRCEIVAGVLQQQARRQLQQFFQARRPTPHVPSP